MKIPTTTKASYYNQEHEIQAQHLQHSLQFALENPNAGYRPSADPDQIYGQSAASFQDRLARQMTNNLYKKQLKLYFKIGLVIIIAIAVYLYVINLQGVQDQAIKREKARIQREKIRMQRQKMNQKLQEETNQQVTGKKQDIMIENKKLDIPEKTTKPTETQTPNKNQPSTSASSPSQQKWPSKKAPFSPSAYIYPIEQYNNFKAAKLKKISVHTSHHYNRYHDVYYYLNQFLDTSVGKQKDNGIMPQLGKGILYGKFYRTDNNQYKENFRDQIVIRRAKQTQSYYTQGNRRPKLQLTMQIEQLQKQIGQMTHPQSRLTFQQSLSQDPKLSQQFSSRQYKKMPAQILDKAHFYHQLSLAPTSNPYLQAEYYMLDKLYNIGQYGKELALCVVIVGRNNQEQIYRNLQSVKNQNYSNYQIVYVDDASQDGTVTRAYQAVDQMSTGQFKDWGKRVTIITQRFQRNALHNRHLGNNYCKQESIIVDLDADDYLIGQQVFQLVNSIYQAGNLYKSKNYQLWCMYLSNIYTTINGQPEAALYGQIKEQILEKNLYRLNGTWRTTQLRTYKKQLYKKVDWRDYVDRLSLIKGQFYVESYDVFMQTPLVEMAGPEHIRILDQFPYFYTGSPQKYQFGQAYYTYRQAKILPRYNKLASIYAQPTRDYTYNYTWPNQPGHLNKNPTNYSQILSNLTQQLQNITQILLYRRSRERGHILLQYNIEKLSELRIQKNGEIVKQIQAQFKNIQAESSKGLIKGIYQSVYSKIKGKTIASQGGDFEEFLKKNNLCYDLKSTMKQEDIQQIQNQYVKDGFRYNFQLQSTFSSPIQSKIKDIDYSQIQKALENTPHLLMSFPSASGSSQFSQASQPQFASKTQLQLYFKSLQCKDEAHLRETLSKMLASSPLSPIYKQLVEHYYKNMFMLANKDNQLNNIEQEPAVCMLWYGYNAMATGATDDLLDTIDEIQYENFKVFVIDDNSPDLTAYHLFRMLNSTEQGKQTFARARSHVKIIRNSLHLGFIGNVYLYSQKYCGEQDIVVVLSQDWKLLGSQVIRAIVNGYTSKKNGKKDIWLTSSKYIHKINEWDKIHSEYVSKNQFPINIYSATNMTASANSTQQQPQPQLMFLHSFRRQLISKIPISQFLELRYNPKTGQACPKFIGSYQYIENKDIITKWESEKEREENLYKLTEYRRKQIQQDQLYKFQQYDQNSTTHHFSKYSKNYLLPVYPFVNIAGSERVHYSQEYFFVREEQKTGCNKKIWRKMNMKQVIQKESKQKQKENKNKKDSKGDSQQLKKLKDQKNLDKSQLILVQNLFFNNIDAHKNQQSREILQNICQKQQLIYYQQVFKQKNSFQQLKSLDEQLRFREKSIDLIKIRQPATEGKFGQQEKQASLTDIQKYYRQMIECYRRHQIKTK